MDRINGLNTIDIGGGRRGFRGRDTANGVPGTEVAAAWLNDLQEEICGFVEFSGLALNPNDHTLFRKAERRLRLRQDRVVVPAGGVAISAADESKTFVLDLAVRQTLPLPNPVDLWPGFSLIVETKGSPSGLQTASVSVAVGAGPTSINFRGTANTPLYLIGRGETFEFTVGEAGWVAACRAQPLPVGATLGSSSTALGIQPLGAAWVRPASCRDGADDIALFGGVAANNAPANDKIIAPATGLYLIRLQGEFIAATGSTAGGQAGVMNGNPATTAAVSSNFWVLNPIGLWTSGDDYRFPTTVRFAQAGAQFWPAFLSTSSLNYYPQSTVLSVSFVSR